jgi:hypothetical protein
MKTRSRFPTRLLAAGALAAAVSTPALAQTFTVNEGVVDGANQNTVTADRISFNYAAMIDQTLVGSSYDGNDPFTESGYLTKASFANSGAAVASQLNAAGSNGYGIYGLFTINGTAAAQNGGILATFESASLSLFLDPGQNTTFSFSGNTAAAGGTTGDDRLLATYTLQQGQAHVFGGLANGDFDTILNMTLTPFGQTYFNSPSPFYAIENFGGNTQTISGASLTSSFVASATGAGTELFIAPIPEPETYALMLAGLGAIGFVARRRKA